MIGSRREPIIERADLADGTLKEISIEGNGNRRELIGLWDRNLMGIEDPDELRSLQKIFTDIVSEMLDSFVPVKRLSNPFIDRLYLPYDRYEDDIENECYTPVFELHRIIGMPLTGKSELMRRISTETYAITSKEGYYKYLTGNLSFAKIIENEDKTIIEISDEYKFQINKKIPSSFANLLAFVGNYIYTEAQAELSLMAMYNEKYTDNRFALGVPFIHQMGLPFFVMLAFGSALMDKVPEQIWKKVFKVTGIPEKLIVTQPEEDSRAIWRNELEQNQVKVIEQDLDEISRRRNAFAVEIHINAIISDLVAVYPNIIRKLGLEGKSEVMVLHTDNAKEVTNYLQEVEKIGKGSLPYNFEHFNNILFKKSILSEEVLNSYKYRNLKLLQYMTIMEQLHGHPRSDGIEPAVEGIVMGIDSTIKIFAENISRNLERENKSNFVNDFIERLGDKSREDLIQFLLEQSTNINGDMELEKLRKVFFPKFDAFQQLENYKKVMDQVTSLTIAKDIRSDIQYSLLSDLIDLRDYTLDVIDGFRSSELDRYPDMLGEVLHEVSRLPLDKLFLIGMYSRNGVPTKIDYTNELSMLYKYSRTLLGAGGVGDMSRDAENYRAMQLELSKSISDTVNNVESTPTETLEEILEHGLVVKRVGDMLRDIQITCDSLRDRIDFWGGGHYIRSNKSLELHFLEKQEDRENFMQIQQEYLRRIKLTEKQANIEA